MCSLGMPKQVGWNLTSALRSRVWTVLQRHSPGVMWNLVGLPFVSVDYQVVLERERMSFLNASPSCVWFCAMPAGAVDLSKNCGLFVLAAEARGMIEFNVFRKHSKESLRKSHGYYYIASAASA